MVEFLVRYSGVYDELHLFGGLRAGTHRDDGSLIVWPTTAGRGVQFVKIKDTRQYRGELQSIGLDVVGWEEVGENFVLWRVMAPSGVAAISEGWADVANAAYDLEDDEAVELASNVAFALRAASLRLRDISREYGNQAVHVIRGQIELGCGFSNVQVMDLFVALHSFLTEAATARDYLARFIAARIWRVASVPSMSVLYQRAKADMASTGMPLVADILRICNRREADGWLARLGHFRDRITHDGPIAKLREGRYLVAKPMEIGGRTLPRIYAGIRSDPFDDASPFVDALEHFRMHMLHLLEFARLVLRHSPIEPKRFGLTDDDLRE